MSTEKGIKNDPDFRCPTCKKVVGWHGYCGHCAALGDGNPYQQPNDVLTSADEGGVS